MARMARPCAGRVDSHLAGRSVRDPLHRKPVGGVRDASGIWDPFLIDASDGASRTAGARSALPWCESIECWQGQVIGQRESRHVEWQHEQARQTPFSSIYPLAARCRAFGGRSMDATTRDLTTLDLRTAVGVYGRESGGRHSLPSGFERGDSVWHTHPSGAPVHGGDVVSAGRSGRDGYSHRTISVN